MNKYTEEIRDEVRRSEPNVGEAELQVAIEQVDDTEATGTSLISAIIKKLRDWRKPFLSTSTLATERAKEYQASERAARERLLQNSNELNALSKLEKEDAELDRKAKAQAAKLETLFAEWSDLPVRAAKLHHTLGSGAFHR